MNEILTIQDLTNLLAAKHGVPQENAEAFVKDFFLLIEQTLEKESMVQIKGLGTFKLADVEEHTPMKGHAKLAFTPDIGSKDANNPFVLPFEEETTTQREDTEQNDVQEEKLQEEEPPMATGSPLEEEEKGKLPISQLIIIIAVILLLCGGLLLYMYHPNLFSSANKETEISMPDTTTYNDVVTEPATENKEKTTATEKQTSSTEATQQQSKKTTYSDAVSYKIVGTKTNYTIKKGDTLAKISKHFYGTTTLWTYIVKHNPDVIKNPDNVPSGTVIKIPELAEK